MFFHFLVVVIISGEEEGGEHTYRTEDSKDRSLQTHVAYHYLIYILSRYLFSFYSFYSIHRTYETSKNAIVMKRSNLPETSAIKYKT